ncbi:glycosyltransferase family 32 protein [Microbacterium sp. SLBN-111]|uniref:glycosyltransferase family 32 protein n=1 Tax=Microbacterium sp. SLBN-111 TaxID=3377733 RepID=UPI003C746251
MNSPTDADQNGPQPQPPLGFEEDDLVRSDYIRAITIDQISRNAARGVVGPVAGSSTIPRTLVRYWHDPSDIPQDVAHCLATWLPLHDEGVEFRLFGDSAARAYISEHFDERAVAAFDRCHHPAMRSDFFRMCFILADGGLYVDADDVLLGDGWRQIFDDRRLLLQPLAYDLNVHSMVAMEELLNVDLPTSDKIFYLNNNPIAAPPNHRAIKRALDRATDTLLRNKSYLEIQSTTGPGNLTASLAAHARVLAIAGEPADFNILLEWYTTSEPFWDLEYRNDARNWRNIGPS